MTKNLLRIKFEFVFKKNHLGLNMPFQKSQFESKFVNWQIIKSTSYVIKDEEST